MDWARILAYATGKVDQELLVRNEYLAAENRILKAQLNGRLAAPRAAADTGAQAHDYLGDLCSDPRSAVCGDRLLHRRGANAARACDLLYVLFFIHIESRRVDIAGITVLPNEAWMKQIARNATMEVCAAAGLQISPARPRHQVHAVVPGHPCVRSG